MDWELSSDADDLIELVVGETMWCTSDGYYELQHDLRVRGERWRIHKSDADPYPSNPHAHCVDGKYAGCKLHLGNRQLFDGPRALNQYLNEGQFERLLVYARQKFPELEFPLP